MPSSQTIRDALGNPVVVESIDYASILAELRSDLIARFPSIQPHIDLETEPARMVLEVAAYRETLLRARVNDAARVANSYWFATGSSLDYRANFYDVTRLTGETDERLRTRIWLAITGRSTGGTAEHYKLVALSSSPDVAEAYVWRVDPTPIVRVAIRSTAASGVASAALLQTVSDALNDPSVRMVNDTLEIVQAVTTTTNIVADIWLLPGQSQDSVAAIRAELLAAWDRESSIGFDLTRSWIIGRLMQAGVQRVSVQLPAADVSASEHQSISIASVTLNFMGRAF